MHYAWFVLVAACIIMGVTMGIAGQSAGIFFTPVGEELGFGRGPLALYLTIQAVFTLLALPIAGRIIPKANFKLTQTAAAVAILLGFMAMSQYQSLTGWYVSGAVIGIALGFTAFLSVPVMLSNWFKVKTGLVIGIAMAFTGVGGAVFNMTGTMLITKYGWRYGYFGLGLIGLVVLLPCTLFLVSFKPEDKGLSPYGEEQKPQEGNPSQRQTAAAMVGVGVKEAIKTPSFWLIIATAALLAAVGMFAQHLPGFVQSIGLSAATGGALISILMLVSILSKVLLGALNDKWGIAKASTLAILISICGMGAFLIAGNDMFLLYAGTILYGIGVSASAIEPPLMVRQVFGAKDYSSIFSYAVMALNLFAGVGVTVYGFMFDRFGSYTPTIIMMIAFYVAALLSIMFALRLGRNLEHT